MGDPKERPTGLLQGTLDMLVLKALAHGYDVAAHILAWSGDVLRVEEGALYPALHRLELRGLLVWMVLRESLWMVAAGLVVGIPAALALTKYVQASLYGIKPNDPASFVAAGALRVAVAAMAAWIPARLDPMRASRKAVLT